MNDAFASAGLRLLRIPLKAIADEPALRAQVFGEKPQMGSGGRDSDAMDEEPDQTRVIRPLQVAADPMCRCGHAMVRRAGKYGPFWGCPTYPTCDHTIPIR